MTTDAPHDNGLEPIAIIAMNGRFPGAKNVAEFWENLRNGVESIKFFTYEELAGAHIDPELLKNPRFVRADGVLDDIDKFDAEFFNYTPREASVMDPQHRLFLEAAWESLELAGYNTEIYDGRVGVFAGAGMSSYLIRNLVKNKEFVHNVGSFQTMLGNDKDFVSTKVSYKMNLTGPSVNTNTLCSSSMVGIHLACQGLWDFQIDMAVAGGVSIQISRNEAFFYQEGGIGAFDGHCRAFDYRAGGTVSGSGLGIVVLKRLQDAIDDGDYIHAVIRGSAINNDGGVKMSYTAPSIEGQAEVIAEAQAMANINPETINYVECHGTGTSLGDPIEIAGLTKAFRQGTEKKTFCAVGSVKTNIGHLVSAGGVASLIKTVEALKHRQIPPSLNFEKPNPKIDFANSPFFVNTELRDWENVGDSPLRAGVSSFGIGGTNAHAVVEEAPARPEPDEARPWQLIPLSARTESSLAKAAENLAAHLRDNPDLNLADVAYTYQVGRRPFNFRRVLVCQDTQTAAEQLANPKAGFTQFQESGDRPVVFMFSGQGSQYVDMAKDLYLHEPYFREKVDACCDILEPHLGLDLREIIYPGEGDAEQAAERLKQTAFTQPALFVIEYALAELWISWGIQPKAMIGHSIGEYVAACIAGVFSLEDALALVAARGKMIQDLPGGDMLAISLPEKEVLPLLSGNVNLATINGPTNCVVSGPSDEIASLRTQMTAKNIEAREVHTSHAFHSAMMEPAVGPFTERVAQVTLNAPEIPYISNVSGTWITDEQATDPAYWAQHLRQAVRFSDGLGELLKQAEQILLEVGPGRTLSTFARQHPAKDAKQAIQYCVRHPKEKSDDMAFMLNAAGKLWLAGAPIDWYGMHADWKRLRLPLPTYPFERKTYWIAPDKPEDLAGGPILGRKADPADWYYIPSWKKTVAPRLTNTPPSQCWLMFIDEHGIGAKLAKKLQGSRQRVVIVRAGDHYEKLEEDLYMVRPGEGGDYDSLLNDLRARERVAQAVVHLWNLSPNDEGDLSRLKIAGAHERGFYSLIASVQGLGRQGFIDPLLIATVSTGMQDVGGRSVRPEKASMLGPMRVIPQESPNITCRNIDVVMPPAGSWKEERMVDMLFHDLLVKSTDFAVAYTANLQRWARTYEPAKVEKPEKPVFQEGALYVITGGTSEAGLALAERLTADGSINLALTTDETFPAVANWDGWLKENPSETGTVNAIHKLKQLQANGCGLMVGQVAVNDTTALAGFLKQAVDAHGPIKGVIHAAGLVGRDVFAGLSETNRDHCEAQFQSKAHTLLSLEKALDEHQPDFCLVLSSLSSQMGGLGLTAYAGANNFAEAFVAYHNAENPHPWTSITWDGWQMTDAGAEHNPLTAALSNLAVSLDEGVDAVARVIARRDFEQVVLAPEDIRARQKWIVEQQGEGGGMRDESFEFHPRPDLLNAYEAPRNEMEKRIAEIWQERLGIEKVGIHDNFFELGGDSLLIQRVRANMQDAFSINLLTSDIFEHPTVSQLAEHLGSEKDEAAFDHVQERARQRQEAIDEEDVFASAAQRGRFRFDDD